jgi:hypothetical protein
MLSVLAFESMDDPHTQWLQMACAIWGEKYTFNILQSIGISWMCSTLVNEGMISVFFVPFWQSSCTKNSSKVAKVIH